MRVRTVVIEPHPRRGQPVGGIALGFGHGAKWWPQVCDPLRMAGFDGWLSFEHEDVLLNAREGLEKPVTFLQGVMPVATLDPKPQDI